MEQKIKDYSAEIERMEQMEALENELNKPVNTPILTNPQQTGSDGKPKTGRASDEYREGMLAALRSNFKQVSNVLQEGVDADGGYLVPEEYDRRLIDVLEEENIMRKLGTKITTSGDHKINIAATKPAAAWIEEGGALTFGDATFDQILLDSPLPGISSRRTWQAAAEASAPSVMTSAPPSEALPPLFYPANPSPPRSLKAIVSSAARNLDFQVPSIFSSLPTVPLWSVHSNRLSDHSHVHTNPTVVYLLVLAVFLPNKIRHRELRKPLLYLHFRLHVTEVVCLKPLPFLHIVSRQIPCPASVCFGRLA